MPARQKIVQIETEVIFYPWQKHPMFMCMLWCHAASTVLVLKLFAYFMEVDRCTEMRSADAKV